MCLPFNSQLSNQISIQVYWYLKAIPFISMPTATACLV